jgi:hypothetical protein
MNLTQEELLFINEVTKGREPFGLFLKYPEQDEMEKYKMEVVKSLQEKGILSETQSFTQKGIALLLLWEEYRNCEKHLIMNHTYLSISQNRRVVGIKKTKGEYQLFSTDSMAILYTILRDYKFLQQEDIRKQYKAEKVSYEAWSKEIETFGDQILIIGDYRKKEVLDAEIVNQEEVRKECVYYWKDHHGYMYDMNLGERREAGPRTIRMELLRYLGIAAEERILWMKN